MKGVDERMVRRHWSTHALRSAPAQNVRPRAGDNCNPGRSKASASTFRKLKERQAELHRGRRNHAVIKCRTTSESSMGTEEKMCEKT